MNRRFFFRSIVGASAVATAAATATPSTPAPAASLKPINTRKFGTLAGKPWQPTPKQLEALSSRDELTIYTGGRGNGATELGMAFLTLGPAWGNEPLPLMSGYRGLFVARSEFLKWEHAVRLAERFGGAVLPGWRLGFGNVLLPTGGEIDFVCPDHLDEWALHRQAHRIFIDDLCRLTPTELLGLKSCLRGSPQDGIPPDYLQILAAAKPVMMPTQAYRDWVQDDSPLDPNWVRDTFLVTPQRIKATVVTATIADNPYLGDPAYLARLQALV